jgi:hypothetical protein
MFSKFILSKIFFTFSILLSFAIGKDKIHSSSYQKPSWLLEPPKGKYFDYYTSLGISDASLVSAQKQAITNILSAIVMEKSVTIQSELKTSISETMETINGKTKSSLIDKATMEVIATGQSETVENLSKEEEYWEEIINNGKYEYRYWMLMKRPKPKYNGLDLSMMTVKQSYGVFPIVKSVFVPGWGQIHKKEKKKGLRFLTGFAVTLTAGIASQSFSNNYAVDAQNADTGEWIGYYNTLSEQYYLASTISYILAGAIYGYNVYDAISSKGAKIYAIADDVGVYLTLAQGNNQVPQLSISIDL